MTQGFQSGYPPPNGVGSNHNSNSAEQARIVELLLQMPYLVMVHWIVARGNTTGEWIMPPGQLEQLAEIEHGGTSVPGSSRAEQWEGKPNGRITQPPVILAWDEQPQLEGVEQFLKGSSLTLNNSVSFPGSISSKHPSAFQPLASSTITANNNPARERTMVAVTRKPGSTGYPYRYSPYFKVAERLIQSQMTDVIPPDMLADCKLVLALIIAWCNYPLFKSEGSSRQGEWMTLSRVKMARELGKQDARIGECLGELARVGLIQYGLAGEEFSVISCEEFDWLAYDCKYLPRLPGSVAAFWWGGRSCQKKRTLFYRLLVRPEEVLPAFEPFGSGGSAGSTSDREQHSIPVILANRNETGINGPGAANGGKDQISRAWNDPGRNVRTVQKQLELHRKDVGSTRNDLNRREMTLERQENDQQVVPRSFQSSSFSSCSNVLNDDDVVDANEELTRSREYNSGTIKAKTTQSQHQSNISRPARLKDNLSQAQPQARKQEGWQGNEEEQGEGQEEAEEVIREEVVSVPENDKVTGPERPRPNRLQEEIAALRRSPQHWAKFEYLTNAVSFAGFEKDGKSVLDESQCVRLAASETTSLELFKERHAQVLQMWEQGQCYSPLGLFYTAVRDNYDPRSEGTVSEEMQLAQVVRRATKLMEYQSHPPGEEDGGNVGRVPGYSAPYDVTSYAENEHHNRKENYDTRASTTPRMSNKPFSLRRPQYNIQSQQSYYHSNNRQRYSARTCTSRSNWQAGSYSYQPGYQSYTNPSSQEEQAGSTPPGKIEEEELTVQEVVEDYQPQLQTSVVDPQITMERLCQAVGPIFRRPDLQKKLAEARLELDTAGKKATIWLAGGAIEARSLLTADRSIIKLAFSREIESGYNLEIR
jgi:hypothetical protein